MPHDPARIATQSGHYTASKTGSRNVPDNAQRIDIQFFNVLAFSMYA
jgi:hypothetical protein